MKKYRVNVNGTAYEVEIELIDANAVASAPAAAVKKGDVLMVLEAMKMENEIMAPCDGTVAGVAVAQGAAVDSGAVLCTIA